MKRELSEDDLKVVPYEGDYVVCPTCGAWNTLSGIARGGACENRQYDHVDCDTEIKLYVEFDE